MMALVKYIQNESEVLKDLKFNMKKQLNVMGRLGCFHEILKQIKIPVREWIHFLLSIKVSPPK